MKIKWCFSTLIIILTFLGISHEQFALPNQEIVLQFNNDEVTSNEAQNAIAIVKQQLQAIGVSYTQVRKQDGKLKITYYSNIDIASIKKILSKKNNVELDYTYYNQDNKDFPVDTNSKNYELDIYEIQNGSDLESGFDGSAIRLKTENDSFFTPNVFVSFRTIPVRDKDIIEAIAYAFYTNSAIAIQNTLHKIPQVRAGPVTIGDI